MRRVDGARERQAVALERIVVRGPDRIERVAARDGALAPRLEDVARIAGGQMLVRQPVHAPFERPRDSIRGGRGEAAFPLVKGAGNHASAASADFLAKRIVGSR